MQTKHLTSMLKTTLFGTCLFILASCQQASVGADEVEKVNVATNASLVVAGGCFWCVESDFEKLDSVGDAISGYAGGNSQQPTYRNHADHLEVVRIPYDNAATDYRTLIDYFLRHIDPLDPGGQFCDRGHSYTTAIFYSNEDERIDAEAAIAAAEAELGTKVVTRVLPLTQFWQAEDYHQDYYKKNPIRYKYYRNGCGRDERVAEVWG